MKTIDKDFELNPIKALRLYAQELGLDLSMKLTTEQFRFLFLKIIDDYLYKRISLEILFHFIWVLDFTLRDQAEEKGLDDLNPDEIIEYISDISSTRNIQAHEPSLDLVEKTDLLADDYPYDWPMRELLRYYKKHRHVLNEFRHDHRSVRTEEA